MNVIIWLIVGGVIGWLASKIMNTDAEQGIGLNVVVGIVGALLTGIFNAKPLGGPGLDSLALIPHQLWIQFEGVLITLVWSGAVAFAAYFIADKLCGGMRVGNDKEREGLDVTTHGESAYQR